MFMGTKSKIFGEFLCTLRKNDYFCRQKQIKPVSQYEEINSSPDDGSRDAGGADGIYLL
jgi:hypothetical protein